MAKETYSEKIMKDTLKYLWHQNEIKRSQKIDTPQYQPESVDFLVTTNDTRSHWIEVKESGSGNVGQSRFNEIQLDILGDPDYSDPQSHTYAWVLVRFYDGERTRASSSYYEDWFLLPGIFARETSITLKMCLEDPRSTHLASYRAKTWLFGMEQEAGLTTKGNATHGLSGLLAPIIERGVTNHEGR